MLRMTPFLIASLLMASDGSALAAGFASAECPQGHQIRAQKTYPRSMSDCEVLDADTAVENRKLRRTPSAPAPELKSFQSGNRFDQIKTEAILYEEDANAPRGRRYVGSVTWRTEQVKSNIGQTSDLAVRADVDIPERMFKMAMSFRRNNDSSLPASHTTELTFVSPQVVGGLSDVPGVILKSTEQAPGVPLAGLAAKISDGFFMFGLSNAAVDRQRNLELVKESSWFDIPIVFRNGRRAILSFKKGAAGQSAFDQAFTVWNGGNDRQQKAGSPVATSDPDAMTVEMTVTATSQNPPVIAGTTNLPNGTILSVMMVGEPPGCVPRCGIGPANTVVENGRFTIGTKLTGTEKLLGAIYKIDITMMSRGQTDPVVKSAIGPNGEHLRGSYVASLGDGPGVGYIPIKFPRTSPPSEGERYLGLDINFTQRVSIGNDTKPDTTVTSQELAKARELSAKDCAFAVDFVNAAIKLGKVTGREVLGAQRQEKINSCISEHEEKLQAALLSPSAPAAPSVRTIDHDWVTAKMERIDRHFWLAFNASICQLRSDAWFGAIRMSWDAWHDRVIRESGITYDQANKLSSRVRAQVEAELGQFPNICQRLKNSQILDNLDAFETTVTGNYH